MGGSVSSCIANMFANRTLSDRQNHYDKQLREAQRREDERKDYLYNRNKDPEYSTQQILFALSWMFSRFINPLKNHGYMTQFDYNKSAPIDQFNL